MGATGGVHYLGDIVTPNREIEGLVKGQHYEIVHIRRGIDGAIDFDDIYLKDIPGNFCEFHLDTVSRGKNG